MIENELDNELNIKPIEIEIEPILENKEREKICSTNKEEKKTNPGKIFI